MKGGIALTTDILEKQQLRDSGKSIRNARDVLTEINNAFKEIIESKSGILNDALTDRLRKIQYDLERLGLHGDGDRRSVFALNQQLEQNVINHLDTCRSMAYESLNIASSGLSGVVVENKNSEYALRNALEENYSIVKIKRLLSRIEDKYGIKISKSERRVLIHLFSGNSNKDIAQKLSISEKTVKNHLWRVYKKIGVKSRTQLFHYLINP